MGSVYSDVESGIVKERLKADGRVVAAVRLIIQRLG